MSSLQMSDVQAMQHWDSEGAGVPAHWPRAVSLNGFAEMQMVFLTQMSLNSVLSLMTLLELHGKNTYPVVRYAMDIESIKKNIYPIGNLCM